MMDLTSNEWKRLRAHGVVTIRDTVITWEDVRLAAIPQVVREYANFVSSAEMVASGRHLQTELPPPVLTHLSQASLLTCRNMAAFFNHGRQHDDDVIASDYAPGFAADLPVWFLWKDTVDRRLMHTTYTHETSPPDITQQDKLLLYSELQTAWKELQDKLSDPFAAQFHQEIVAIPVTLS